MTDCGLICNNEGVALVVHGEERAELKGEAVVLPIFDLCYNPHLYDHKVWIITEM